MQEYEATVTRVGHDGAIVVRSPAEDPDDLVARIEAVIGPVVHVKFVSTYAGATNDVATRVPLLTSPAEH
ncbi:hypothetical protein ACFVWR_15440 [Leifsonia sp. NPDC058292]|uniref:hypothetical protein n=1 Tax=Leifsonia sp. NPDC058292 TaxID=3346428 RepID=UPI0036D9071B